jgi:Uma2 family endonuclease
MVGEMATQPNPLMSVRQYLDLLEKSEIRYEYWDGEIVAMSGASRAHNLISASILSNLWQQLRKSDCKPVGGNQLIHAKEAQRYVFADVVVRCQKANYEPGVVPALNDPVVVFEVLSPSTEAIDRSKKFEYYTTFESLRELVLVSQSEKLVEHFYRGSSAETWRVKHVFHEEDEIVLESVGAKLSVAKIYEAVEW